ncbi:MAG: hypothetical protein AABX51_03170, partial [Nanoarchaeota archaeon]
KPDEPPGIYVLERLGKKDDEIVSKLTETLVTFTLMSGSDRIHNKIEARRLASLADWKILIKNYLEAHRLALSKKF